MAVGARRSAMVVGLALMILSVIPASAQQSTGNLYGTVVDEEGDRVPGVNVTLAGPGALRSAVSDRSGAFRFLDLDPGVYLLTGEVEGFSPIVVEDLEVRVGLNLGVELEFVREISETMVVTPTTPLLDRRKIEQGTTLTKKQLDVVPTARDPWSLLNQVPGVLADRVNVGGNEGGQQSVFIAPGASKAANNYAIDGVQVTDMTVASSSTYFDFESFEEARITTGGADVSLVSSGVTLNLVTKRGTDTPRGAARLFTTDDSLQSSPDISRSSFAPGQTEIATNEIRDIYESGIELGGPLIRGKLWAWGSWARNDINQNAAGGAPDDTLLENSSFKLNAQPTSRDIFAGWYYNSDKVKLGRGAGPGRAAETTWDQGGDGSQLWKVEASRLVTPSLFVTGFYADTVQDFDLVAKGGVGSAAPEAILGPDGVFRGGFQSLFFRYPTAEQAQLAGSWFVSTQRVGHEVRGGFRSRKQLANLLSQWPGGRDLVNIAGVNFGLPDGPQDIFFLNRSDDSGTLKYVSVWLQDTMSFDRWTVNAGLRWDRQRGVNHPVRAAANPVRPDIFPAIDTSGDEGSPFVWEDLQPRVGVTWAATDQMLVRGSYSRYVQQLIGDDIIRTNPLSFPGPSAFFLFIDQDGDNRFDEGEFSQFLFGRNFDVFDPTSSPNRTDPDLEAERTNEIILQVEKSLSRDLIVGASLTHRRIDRIHEQHPLIRVLEGDGSVRVVSSGDYTPGAMLAGSLPDGSSFSVPTWSLRPGLFWTGGTLLMNGDREQEYLGVTVFGTKRLSNRWMVQGHLNWSDFEWKVPRGFRERNDPNDELGSGDNDGDVVAEQGSLGLDSKENVFLNSRWNFSLAGMVEIAPDRPWGFDLSANMSGRDGYPLPYYATVVGADGISRDIQLTKNVDSFRAEDLISIDVGLRKEVPFGEHFQAAFDLTVFNLFNEATVLQRALQLNGPRANFLEETLSPRVVRVGVRLEWN